MVIMVGVVAMIGETAFLSMEGLRLATLGIGA